MLRSGSAVPPVGFCAWPRPGGGRVRRLGVSSKGARLGRGAAPRPDEWAGAAPGSLSRIKEGSEAKGRRCCCDGQQRVFFG